MRIGLAVVLACAHGRTPLAPSVPRPLSERADPLVAAADHAQRALLGLLGMDRDDAALVDQCAARAARASPRSSTRPRSRRPSSSRSR